MGPGILADSLEDPGPLRVALAALRDRGAGRLVVLGDVQETGHRLDPTVERLDEAGRRLEIRVPLQIPGQDPPGAYLRPEMWGSAPKAWRWNFGSGESMGPTPVISDRLQGPSGPRSPDRLGGWLSLMVARRQAAR